MCVSKMGRAIALILMILKSPKLKLVKGAVMVFAL